MGKVTTDIIVDLQYGDSGKGKVAYHLAKNGNYTHVVRYSGGANAGHTVYHGGKKFVTHLIPVGVFFGIPSVIAGGCVLNVEGLFEEIDDLEKQGLKVRSLIKIANNTHIVTQAHLDEEGSEKKVGTTKRGIGPAYRDKHARTGVRAEDIPELSEFLIDFHELVHSSEKDLEILCEGAQGYGLDIDWGDYPYVTSSHPTVAGAIQSGIPRESIRDVWGVIKAYETYVGAKDYQPEGDVFKAIQKAGNEFGATTGRPRQTNWTDINLVTRGAQHNSITKLVINKYDILREVGKWGLVENGEAKTYKSEAEFRNALLEFASGLGLDESDVFLSESPEEI